MNETLLNKIINALEQQAFHNSSIMARPEVILWPDPEKQWESIISILQQSYPALMIYGTYNPTAKSGPAIWLKSMVAGVLPEANWDKSFTPVIYLPGISKNDLKNVQNADLSLQPLLEFQYTGTIYTQENGKEWSILAFLQNNTLGMGLKVLQDTATKDALKKGLSSLLEENGALYDVPIINAAYINNLLLPEIIPSILKWMCSGDVFLDRMDSVQKETFINLCRSHYDFIPDHKNIKEVAEKLGAHRNSWKQVWHYYANAPEKFPEIMEWLRLAKPADLGSGMFTFPEESWPQVNEEKEEKLRKDLLAISKLAIEDAKTKLYELEKTESKRRKWVWAALGFSPLAQALPHLLSMVEITSTSFPSSSINGLQGYYVSKGYQADQGMRRALAAVKSEKDKTTITAIITAFYKPWLISITDKFQALVEKEGYAFFNIGLETEKEEYLLFVDAFRYELAEDFTKRFLKSKYKVNIGYGWSAIPSLTPTAKPAISPIASQVSLQSEINEFRPHLLSGKDLQTAVFRDTLSQVGYIFKTTDISIESGKKYWQEIGEIDTRGHEEQANVVKRVDELFDLIQETIETAFTSGIRRIKIVTDHGWLLLPGGLPKVELNKDLTATRWGRCALIKEGAHTSLLHLPWKWNPSIFIAYAPGIGFFKKNEAYAHGGISLHECLVPELIIENPITSTVNSTIKEVKWVNLRCNIKTEGALDGFKTDIRTKHSDSGSTVVISDDKLIKNDKSSLLVDYTNEGQAVTVVLMDENERILDKLLTQVGG